MMNFTTEGCAQLLPPGVQACMDKGDITPGRLFIRDFLASNDDPMDPNNDLALLVGLFMFGMSFTRTDLDLTLGERLVSDLFADDVVGYRRFVDHDYREADGLPYTDWHICSRIDIRPVTVGQHDYIVASDWGMEVTGKPLDGDHVLGVGGATLTLLSLIPTNHIISACDVGCGCGILALFMSRFCNRVIATDISERALAFTRFNCLLNDITNVDIRHGSLLEPLGDDTVDLVVSNPPFVITPPRIRSTIDYTYRDGGYDGDDVMTLLLSDVTQHVNPGGHVVMLGNWIDNAAGDNDTPAWARSITPTLYNTNATWLVLRRDWLTAPEYVRMWLHDSGQHLVPRDDYEKHFANWLTGLTEADIDSIVFGIIAGVVTETNQTLVVHTDAMDADKIDSYQLMDILHSLDERK